MIRHKLWAYDHNLFDYMDCGVKVNFEILYGVKTNGKLLILL